jgi:hypothetical protein
MHSQDRIQRVIIGTVLLLLNLFSKNFSEFSALSIASLFIQIELILTGLIGWCPLYWSLSLKKKK